MAVQVAALGMIAGQFATGSTELILPPAKLVTQRVAAGIADQARGPVSHGVGLGRQWLAAVERLQVLEQHAPGHTVHHR